MLLLFFFFLSFVDGLMNWAFVGVEDIDFEMVYALHTFTATVKGQANATKGEHMVLLDDSNSYWWLVRIVRDASIGKKPAKYIVVAIPADIRHLLV